jgi:hypothetical protein
LGEHHELYWGGRRSGRQKLVDALCLAEDQGWNVQIWRVGKDLSERSDA